MTTSATPEAAKPTLRLAALAKASIAITLVALAGCQLDAAPLSPAERPVQVQQIAFERVQSAQEFVGTVKARRETDLAFRVAGRMASRLVNVGDRVTAGDVIARLEPNDLRLQVQIALADVASAQSALTQAATDLDRYKALKASGFASAADFDRRATAKDEAQGRLDRAMRSLELNRNQLAYAELKATAAGIITEAPVEPGQVVAVGQPIVRLAEQGEKEVEVALSETWLDRARRSGASVTLWSLPGSRYPATLRELSPQSDRATRTYAARFTIGNADASVALGMTATVILARDEEAPVAKLPLGAILSRGTGASVYVVENGALILRQVNVASFNESTAFVSSGVEVGENVVTLGVQKLQAGQRVRIFDTK